MKEEKILPYAVLRQEGDAIILNGVFWGCLSELQKDFPAPDWLVVDEASLPTEWPDMVISNGGLVEASPDVLERRQNAAFDSAVAAVQDARQRQFVAETDSLLFDAIEAFATAHPEYTEFADWLNKKNEIRSTLPKPIRE